MKRRVFVATASTSTAAALAGCSMGDFWGGDNQSNEHYEEALDYLKQTDTELEDLAESGQIPSEWNDEEIQQRVTDAHAALDTAEETGADDLQPQIDNLRTVADFHAAASEYTVGLIDLEDCWSGAGEYLQGSEWEDADAHLDDCEAIADTVESSRDTAETRFEEIDADALAENTDLTYTDLSDKLLFDREAVSTRVEVVRGINAFVDGMTNVTAGITHIEAGEYDAAIQQFEEARDLFGSSAETFEAHTDDPTVPDEVSGDLSEFACIASNGEEGSDYFVRGVEAAQDEDNNTAQSRFNTGRDIFQSDCS